MITLKKQTIWIGVILLLAVIMFFVGLMNQIASSLTCLTPDIETSFMEADAVFSGKIIEEFAPEGSNYSSQSQGYYIVQPSEVFKGQVDIPQRVHFDTVWGNYFDEGIQVLFFANGNGDQLTISACGASVSPGKGVQNLTRNEVQDTVSAVRNLSIQSNAPGFPKVLSKDKYDDSRQKLPIAIALIALIAGGYYYKRVLKSKRK